MKSEIVKQIRNCDDIKRMNKILKLIPKKDFHSYKDEFISVFNIIVENELDKELKDFLKYICVMSIDDRGKLINEELNFCLKYIIKRKAAVLKGLYDMYIKNDNIRGIKDIYDYLIKIKKDKQKLYDYADANYSKIINSIKKK